MTSNPCWKIAGYKYTNPPRNTRRNTNMRASHYACHRPMKYLHLMQNRLIRQFVIEFWQDEYTVNLISKKWYKSIGMTWFIAFTCELTACTNSLISNIPWVPQTISHLYSTHLWTPHTRVLGPWERLGFALPYPRQDTVGGRGGFRLVHCGEKWGRRKGVA